MRYKIGLVLAGGGGKGSYQVGAYEALEEYGLASQIEVISGSSVGALNLLLFSLYKSDYSKHIWRNVKFQDLFKYKFIYDSIKLLSSYVYRYVTSVAIIEFLDNKGYFSQEGLKRIIDKYVDFSKISNSRIKLYVSTTDCMYTPSLMCLINSFLEKPTGKAKYFLLNGQPHEKIKKIVLASSAIPKIYDPIKIDNKKYLDGGISDNIPIKPVYDEGCNLIFVIDMNPTSLTKSKDFPNATILHIRPQKDPGHTLDFSPKERERRFREGYNDLQRILNKASSFIMIDSISKNIKREVENSNLEYKNKKEQLNKDIKSLKAKIKERISWN